MKLPGLDHTKIFLQFLQNLHKEISSPFAQLIVLVCKLLSITVYR